VTPSGIELATFWPVAQSLNKQHAPFPLATTSNVEVNWQNKNAAWITVHFNFLHVLLTGNYSMEKYGQQYNYRTNHTGLTVIWMTDIQSYNPE
jgi:hypothetical protein